MLRIAKNGPEPKVREAKWAAHHQTQGNTRSAEGRGRASGGTSYAVAAKTVKYQGALIFILSFIALLMALSEGASERIGLGAIMAGVSGFILFLTAKWASKKKPSVVFIYSESCGNRI